MHSRFLQHALLSLGSIGVISAISRAQEAEFALKPLQRTISPLHLTDEPVREIIGRMSGSAGIRVSVAWEQCNIEPESKFDVNLSGVSLDAAICALLAETPHMDASGAVVVGQAPEVGAYTLRYNVGDLARADSRVLERGMDNLKNVVEREVQSESWRDNGGTKGGLDVAGDTLIVQQTPGGHAEVQQLVGSLRSAIQLRQGLANNDTQSTAVLGRRVENAAFAAVPLRQVIERLTRDAHVNVIVDIASLERAGIGMDKLITADLSNLTVAQAFDQLIRELADGVTTDFEGGVLKISANEHDRYWIMRQVYDVHGIVAGLCDDPPTAAGDPLHTPLWGKLQPQEAIDLITQQIESNIEPDIWKDNGGAIGSLDYFAGHLVVTATPRVHRQLRILLTIMDDAVTTRPAPPDGTPNRPETVPAQPPSGPARAFDDVSIDLNFDATPFEQALKEVGDKTHARMFVNWRVLEAAGIDRQTPVTLRIKSVKGRSAIDLILDAAGGGQTKLSAEIEDDGIVRISTAEANARGAVVKFYNVQSLIEDALRVHRVFDPNLPNVRPPTGQDAIDELTKLIEDNIDTETWKDNGGAVGSLRIFANTLIVSANPSTQEKVAAFLNKLKAEIAAPRMTPGGR